MKTEKTKWVIDPAHTKVGFRVKHLMIANVTGNFKEVGGEVNTDGDDFSTVDISLSINTASVNTDMPDRDAHLKSPDFFDVENHPEMKFRSTGMKDLGDDIYEITGMLTIKGISKEVKLSAEFGGMMKDPWGNSKAGFTVTGKINRKDWGLNWNAALEAGGLLVGDEVKLQGDVQLTRMAA
jgi:polyisoprenoid-binding protein YceI